MKILIQRYVHNFYISYILFAVPGIHYMVFVQENRLSSDVYEIQLYTRNITTGANQYTFPIPVKFHIYYNTTLSTPQISDNFTTRNSSFKFYPPVIGDIYKIKIKVELIAESPFGIFGIDMPPFDFNTSK